MANAEVFISYSHEDQEWKRQVAVFMEAMKMAGEFSFSFWEDSAINAGEDWESEIGAALDDATVAVVLVSADFMASRYIQEREIPLMLRRQEAEDLVIVPLLLRPCPWSAIDWLVQTQFVNSPGEPLSGCSTHRIEEILTDLSWRVRTIIEGSRTDFDSEQEKEIAEREAQRVGDIAGRFERPTREAPFVDGPFLTTAGVTSLVENSVRNISHSEVVGLIRILRTSRQQTWLVVTDSDVFCILDDEKTAAANRRIQWQLGLVEAEPVRVRSRDGKATGLVAIGPRRNWLYSQRVYPNPDDLKATIEAMIDAGRRG